MVMIEMKTKEGGTKKFPAWKILEHLNDNEDLVVLQKMNWIGDGKKNFLMGVETAVQAEIAKPLSEQDANQAVKEYLQEMGLPTQ